MELIFRRNLATAYAAKLNKIASKHLAVQALPGFLFFTPYCLMSDFTSLYGHLIALPVFHVSGPTLGRTRSGYQKGQKADKGSLVTDEAGLTSLRKTSLLFLASSLEVSASAVLVEN